MNRKEGGTGLSGQVPSRSIVGFSDTLLRLPKRRSVPDVRHAASFGFWFAWKLVEGALNAIGMANLRRNTEAALER